MLKLFQNLLSAFNKKQTHIITKQGRPAFRVLGLPLQRRSTKTNRMKKIVWAGMSSLKCPKKAATEFLRRCERIKDRKFVRKNGKSEGFSSINCKIYNKHKHLRWKALPEEAFFFFNVNCCSSRVTQLVKNFVP